MKSITTILPCTVLKQTNYKHISELLSPVIIEDLNDKEEKQLIWDIGNQFMLLDNLGMNKFVKTTTTEFKSTKGECFYVLYDSRDNLDVVLTNIENSRVEDNYKFKTDMSFYSKRSLKRSISNEFDISVWFTLSTDKNALKQSIIALWTTDSNVLNLIVNLLNQNNFETI